MPYGDPARGLLQPEGEGGEQIRGQNVEQLSGSKQLRLSFTNKKSATVFQPAHGHPATGGVQEREKAALCGPSSTSDGTFRLCAEPTENPPLMRNASSQWSQTTALKPRCMMIASPLPLDQTLDHTACGPWKRKMAAPLWTGPRQHGEQ
ncbi:uncharacterized protein ACNS7B_005698 isoform 2-T4 [Menidia menidia]